MKQTFRHIITRYSNRHMSWLLLPLLLLCLTACSSSDEDQTEDIIPDIELGNKTTTQLYIYVHAPQTAVPTRAYPYDDVDAIGNEAKVYSLQIWVFTHKTNKLIGYFSPTETSALNKPGGYEVLQLTIDEEYAQATPHENVDVYVLANVAEGNCHLTLDHTTTRAQLETAVLAHGTTGDAFGLTAPVTTVPENLGLPMSGVLRNQPVTGTAPVLRLDDGGEMAKVSLIRTVSKLRFVFANQTNNEPLIINSIKLKANMLPNEQYLFMAEDEPYDRETCHINTASGYNATTPTPELLAAPIKEVPTVDQPVIYAWGNEEMEPQEYESMLDAAVAAGDLTQRLYYLRESDKKLQGEIKFKIGDGGEEQTATFQMVDEEGGFSRNHLWTVYAYQAQARLHVVAVKIATWKTTETNYEFYNW